MTYFFSLNSSAISGVNGFRFLDTRMSALNSLIVFSIYCQILRFEVRGTQMERVRVILCCLMKRHLLLV